MSVALASVLLTIQFTCMIAGSLAVMELGLLFINLKVMMQLSSVYRYQGDHALFLLIAVFMCVRQLWGFWFSDC